MKSACFDFRLAGDVQNKTDKWHLGIGAEMKMKKEKKCQVSHDTMAINVDTK